ncbi:MAG: hypothetical protein DAHOPDDO_00466 [Ignavibacteriaceae bacterium]|nr:hypothetical protein [Ignavibacteriales bacterium]MBV6419250.1 hypothetical protein [Ignavibacteriaceae bacterium]GJQ43220.1 MAG: hypothetical protein JETCAE03_27180 [Ignavibacteriaceae bacterium]
MRTYYYLILAFTAALIFSFTALPQEDEEPVNYFQMEPLDDSLFIQIQEALFIDPPDPKAEIVVDVRDANNQTVSIKGALYPFLALSPELRARIITYPFKLNLEETINYGSVYTRVINKLRFEKILIPPSVFQISPSLGYINPYLQFQGGERFGIPIKKDIGLSIGFGTPYSGALETNFTEANFHILGFRGGLFTAVDAFVELKGSENHNNLFVTNGYQFSYVIPFGNFFEIGYLGVSDDFTETQILKYTQQTVNKDNIVYNPDGTIKYQPYLLTGSYLNWEMRYPVKFLGATRGKFYVAQFIDEWHIGYTGRELSLAGSVFDLRFDAMVSSHVRQPQYVLDILVQKIFDYWAFSTISIGPSIIMTHTKSGSFGFTSIFANLRIKVGSSL